MARRGLRSETGVSLPGRAPFARPASARSTLCARSTLIAFCALSAGCFYLDDINQRPAIEIFRRTTTAIERGSTVTVSAIVRDPDSGSVSLSWAGYACAATLDACDDTPIAESSAIDFELEVPRRTAADQSVQHLRVTLVAQDDRGAAALVPQRLDLDVVNAAPQITALQTVGRGFVVGRALELRAQRSDADDPLSSVVLTWEVFPPVGSTRPPLRALPSADPSVEAKELIPDVTGAWEIKVTATDPSGATGTLQRTLVVTGDSPPCLTSLSPPAAAPLFLDELRRFSVLVVEDDLDPYPAVTAPSPGAASFAWSLRAPSRGPARLPLTGVGGTGVELDPAAFSPGEVVELRVEVADREPRTLPCADGDATCSLTGNACAQRQTWRLEVR
jgi:hypothetical protein